MKVYVDANPNMVGYVAVSEPSISRTMQIPDHTNNQAEYQAIIFALRHISIAAANELEILSDSQLVVNQLNHKYHIKDDKLRTFAQAVWMLTIGRKVSFTWIPR